MAKSPNEAYGIRLAALRRKAQQLDALVDRLDNPPEVDYGYVGDLAHVNSILDEALDALGEHADRIGELRELEMPDPDDDGYQALDVFANEYCNLAMDEFARVEELEA